MAGFVNFLQFSNGRQTALRACTQSSSTSLWSKRNRAALRMCAPTSSLEKPSLDMITSGPVFRKAGLKEESIDWDRWFQLSKVLEDSLGKEANFDRVHRLYLPVHFWLREQVLEVKKSGKGNVVIGLQCPQGGGKTTITGYLMQLFAMDGLSCAIASTDDFYLTHKEQKKLAETYPGNPLLELRGNAGSMDLDFMYRTVEELINADDGTEVKVARYNKSAFAGKGDRAPESDWATVKAPVDIIILEGWCMGFQPTGSPADPNLIQVNKFLEDFDKIYSLLDLLLVVEVSDINFVYKWRKQAEDNMKSKGKAGMTDEEIKDFVDRFMPAYREYLPKLYSKGGFSEDLPQLNIKIDGNRAPTD